MSEIHAQAPLSGLNVIELHAIGPVPFAGQVLRSLGARVTRVSPLKDPGLGVPMEKKFDLLNLGKDSLSLDLKVADGLASLYEALARADVLLEGFRPGVLERLGLGPSELLAKFPSLVIGRLSGWGAQGPLAQRAGHDINYLAMSGVLHAIGDKKAPVPPLNLVADFGGGAMHLLVGVLAKLVQRGMPATLGRGGVAETSILAGTLGLTPMFYGMLASGLWNLQRENNLLDGGLPFYRVYSTSDAKHIALGALEPKFYKALIEVLGLEAQVDLATQYSPKTWPATVELFAKTIAQKSRDEWACLAADVDACLSPVLDFLEARDHAHNQANDWFGTADALGPEQIIRFS